MKEDDLVLPAALPALSLICGIFMAPHIGFPFTTASGVVLVASLALFLPTQMRFRGALIALSFAAGILRGAYAVADDDRLREVLDRIGSDRFVRLEGKLTSTWREVRSETSRLTLFESSIEQGTKRVELDRRIDVYINESPPQIGAAERISIEGFLRRSENGRLFLSVKSDQLIATSGIVNRFDPRQWNRTISQKLDAISTSETDDAIALARALALGQSEALPESLRRSYRDGGTYHLLVFSGLQIALAAAALLLFLRWLRQPRIADWLILALALLAPPFAGNEPSVARASQMIGIFAISRLLRRPTEFANLLFVAAAARLLMHPDELHDAGFILTYVATAGILLAGHSLSSFVTAPPLQAIVRGLGAEIALWPLTLFLFNRIVFGGSVITLLVSPVVVGMLATSALLCVAAFSVPPLVEPIAAFLQFLDTVCRSINDIIGSSALSRVALAPPRVVLIGSYVAFMASYLLLAPRRRVVAVLFLLLPMCFVVSRRTTSEPAVEMLDVGQGDALLIRNGPANVLVDGGGRSDDESYGDRVLLPRLLSRGVTSLDVVALTHPHPDHCGGLLTVLREFPVRELWLSGRQWKEGCTSQLFELARERRVPVVVVEHQRQRHVAGMTITTITPRLRFKRASLNNSSIVYRVRTGTMVVLLTGDIERDAERTHVEDGLELRADILKVAHHGSRSSSTEQLLDAVAARVALISCGRTNSYGHPNSEVLERLKARAIRIYRSDLHGTTRVTRRGRIIYIRKGLTP